MNVWKKMITYISIVMFVLTFCFTLITWSAQATTIEIDTINPILLIDKVSAEQAIAGSDFNLSISIRNISNNPGFNLDFSFKVQGTDGLEPFTLKANQNTTIDQIEGNSSRTVMVGFSVSPEAQNKDYQLIVNLAGQNASFQDVVNASTIFTIPVTYDLTKPVLLVKSVSISPENPDPYTGFDAHFQICNLSQTTDARNINLLLEDTDNFEVMDISNKKNISKIEKNAYQTVTYHLKAKDTHVNNTVKLKISFDYLGNQTESVEETINLPLPQENVYIGTTPWVIIHQYTLSSEKVLAGDNVTLRLFIENTHQRAVKNVKISLGVIRIEDTSSSGTGTTTGGTVFSPVNSSNSFYLEEIPGKAVVAKDINLFVDPNAAAKTYIVPVEIKYEDNKGKTLNCEELVNIPVTQECKLQILSTQIPTAGFVGQPVPIIAEFVNVGKVSLGNFMVYIEGEFQKENGTYYVGNLDIGASDFFQGGVIPEKEGEVEGKLVFSYIDNNNKDVRLEEPFTIRIENTPAPVMEGSLPEGKEGMIRGNIPSKKAGKFSFLNSKVVIFFFSIIILLQAIYILRIRKRKKNEEFFDV